MKQAEICLVSIERRVKAVSQKTITTNSLRELRYKSLRICDIFLKKCDISSMRYACRRERIYIISQGEALYRICKTNISHEQSEYIAKIWHNPQIGKSHVETDAPKPPSDEGGGSPQGETEGGSNVGFTSISHN